MGNAKVTALVVGCGRLGKFLAYQLKEAGYEVIGVACSSAASNQAATAATGVPHGCALQLSAKA